MPDLTLEQVREAGRFAFVESDRGYHEYVYRPAGLQFPCGECGASRTQSRSVIIRYNPWHPSEVEQEYYEDKDWAGYGSGWIPQDDWHHEDGCDCEWCRP